MERHDRDAAVFAFDYQDRPDGPWFPWYRYHVETNFLDARITRAGSMLAHGVECVAYQFRPRGVFREACRVADRVEY